MIDDLADFNVVYGDNGTDYGPWSPGDPPPEGMILCPSRDTEPV